MGKRMLRVVILALLLGGAAGGYWRWRTLEKQVPATELVLHGNVDIRQVELAFNGSERIAEMLAEEGQPVREGQVLARLETDRLRHRVDQAAAQLAAQREVLAALEAGTRPEEVRKARADVTAAMVEAGNAERSYERLFPLAAKNLASKEQLDNAKSAAEAARARLQAAQEGLDLAVAGPRKEDVAAARATLRGYQAQLALAQRELADAELRSPAPGVIQDRILEPGDMASPQKPVYTLALTDPLWVRAYLSQPDLGKVPAGALARVTTDSFPDTFYGAWVGYVSPTAEFTPKSVETREVRTSLVYQVRVYVCDGRGELRLGMPATVAIPLGQAPLAPGADPCQRE
jgi:HlyD family secretion protein